MPPPLCLRSKTTKGKYGRTGIQRRADAKPDCWVVAPCHSSSNFGSIRCNMPLNPTFIRRSLLLYVPPAAQQFVGSFNSNQSSVASSMVALAKTSRITAMSSTNRSHCLAKIQRLHSFNLARSPGVGQSHSCVLKWCCCRLW